MSKKPKVKIKNYDEPIMELFQGMVSNLMKNITAMENAINSLDGALSSYIEFNGNHKEWQEWLAIKFKEYEDKEKENDAKSKKSGNSSRGTGINKTDK